MAGTHVRLIWMIYTVVLLLYALIHLAIEIAMAFTEVPESTKQLWKLKLNISNDNKNGG